MPCTKPATGPCSKPPDGPAAPPKPIDTGIAPLTGVDITGFSDHLKIDWDIPISYPGQTVTLITRSFEVNEPEAPRVVTPRDTGSADSVLGLVEGHRYWVWLRAETDTGSTPWQVFLAIVKLGWATPEDFVEHRNEVVYHGADLVLI